MRRAFLLIAFGLVLGFAAGFAVAYWRLSPYHRIDRLITGVAPPATNVPPNYALWRDSYRGETSSVQIVMLGDSITRFGNWPALLGQADITNLGIPGDTTDGVLGRLGDGNIPPGSTVFILAGVNDVVRSVPVERTLANLERIVGALAPGRSIYLQSTLFTERAGLNGDIAKIVAGEKAICRRLRCTFVDLNAVLAPQGVLLAEYSADGIHLTAAGYAKWADIVRPYLLREGDGRQPL